MTVLPLDGGVIEGQTLRGELSCSVDVCIVGSGPGGAQTALAMSKAGLSVVVLEVGGYFTQSRFRMREEDAYTSLYQDGGQRTTKDLGIGIYQGKAVGGGTVVNWTTCFRLPEPVVDHWARRFAMKGFTSEDLLPHFDTIEKRLNIHQAPLDEVNRNNQLLLDGCTALGYEVERIKRNVKGCAKTGYCGLGCPIDAKQSMLVTLLPDAMDRGATVISRCGADRFVFENGAATTLRADMYDATGRTKTGATLEVKAKRFVLSAGAIGTPSILLRSGAPDASGMLGRRTFLHPTIISAAVFSDPVHPYHGAPQSVASHHFADRGSDVGYFLEAAPIQPGLASTAMAGLGQAHRDVMRSLPFTAGHIALLVDGFHDEVPGGRVQLKHDGTPVLDYPIPQKLFAAARAAHKTLATIQLEMGARRISALHSPTFEMRGATDLKRLDDADYSTSRVFVASAHQMGGCLMSDEASRGVTRSEDGRVHGLTNVHVVDGSLFPTSLGVNPQESIYGVAGLLASRIAHDMS